MEQALKLDAEELETIEAIAENKQIGRLTRYEINELVRVYRASSAATSEAQGKVAVEPVADRLVQAELVRRLLYLVSLNEPKHGGPYAGYAAEQVRRIRAILDGLSLEVAKLAEAREIIEPFARNAAVGDGTGPFEVPNGHAARFHDTDNPAKATLFEGDFRRARAFRDATSEGDVKPKTWGQWEREQQEAGK